MNSVTKRRKEQISLEVSGNNLFGDAQIGEFFRAFVSYGVIAVALVLHAWRKAVEARIKRLEDKVLE